MPRLNIIGVDKSFDGNEVLHNIYLETADGELVVVLGPSGCGKSTLLRLIAGLEEADCGEIWIGNRRVDRLSPRKRNVALVFQNYALYPHMTVEKNLAFPLRIGGIPRKEIRERVLSTATLLGLSDKLDSHPAALSGGQRQRVALGRAIIRQPDLYLLDEPLSNLDADLRTRMRRELVEIQKKLGTTTVHVTHDQTEALTMADRLVVMESGRIRQIGTVDDVYNRPADIFVASFIGTPKINLVGGWVEDNLIRPFKISSVFVPSDYRSRAVTVGIRPEDIIITEDGEYTGVVKRSEYLGDRAVIAVDYLKNELILLAAPGQFSQGDTLSFTIRTDKLHLFDKETGRCPTN
ncbi:MAG: ABC transporter ATP-binding protein [Candidatus Zixiibacteriota bacterium]|nr:MAG: ABC transporter ATP-binding protein [candidate division Zixibacteria bacterium]